MANKIRTATSKARTFLHGLFVLFVCVSAFYLCDGKKVASKKVSADVRRMCRSVKWLDKKQRNMCTRYPDSIKKIKIGVDKALTECRRLFKNYRWNCSPLILDDVLLQNGILKKKSRETAFVQALSAAGMMHEIAIACAKGDLQSCGCGSVTTAKKRRNNKKWVWGGCGDNFRYSASFTKKFLDYKRITNHAKKSTSHNYGVGRKVVRDHSGRKCKCHGKSNTCPFKTCWEVVPTMEKVSDEIWKLYQNPVKTRWNHQTKTLTRSKSRTSNVPVTLNVLTFFANSEDFCQQDIPMGIMGTVGRTCNHTSHGYTGCGTMCCGRSYKTTILHTTKKCNCRFVWCCDVKCDRCNTTIITDTCL